MGETTIWVPEETDFTISPYTGLTRKSWIAAGIYILKGLFANIEDINQTMVVQRSETEITYPHLKAGAGRQKKERKAEIFEGLARSFLIASVIIHERPDVSVNGIVLREYYKNQILKCCCHRDDPAYVGTYTELTESNDAGNNPVYLQQTVETCALVIGLECCRKEIWETYTQEERDELAAFLKDYAENPTAPKNWRLFNMLDFAFLAKEGYDIDERIMGDHAQAVLDYYAGDGWYRDGLKFDFYSCWTFSLYGPIWCRWYGYENMPWVAAKVEQYSNRLMETYPDMFDRDGYTNLWGRSCIYRNASASAFCGNLFLKNSGINPGLARRICSGSLLQFLTRDDFLINGVPSIGFYGPFSPVVQSYSCAASPLWLGKAFLCLHFPDSHPFWTAREAENAFDRLPEHGVRETVLPAPGLCFTNHKDNGETIFRTAKVLLASGHRSDIQNYSRLCFNTKYPWEATPSDGNAEPAVESMMYLLRDESADGWLYPNAVFWNGLRDRVLYRREYFDFTNSKGPFRTLYMSLADFPVPKGIFRVDKICFYRRPVTVTLGSFGFPDNGTEIIRKEANGAKAIIVKGHDHMDRPRQMAMTVFGGWQELEVRSNCGTNPDSDNSLLIYAVMRTGEQLYDASKPYLLVSQTITADSLEEFPDEELFPLSSMTYTDPWNSGAYGPVEMKFRDGTVRTIDFEGIEGNLSL